MTRESSQAAVREEGRLAAVSRWATVPLVIPLLTGLSFVASTVFAYLWGDAIGGHGSYGIGAALPMAIVCFVLGVALGFPLRRGVVRIRDAGTPRPGLGIVVAVGVVWALAFLLQWLVFSFMSMSL